MIKPWPLLLLLPFAALAQDDVWDDDDWGDEDEGSAWSGFAEAGFGTRFDEDALIENRSTLEEVRGRIESEWQPNKAVFSLKADVAYDGVENGWDADFRDLTASFSLGDAIDVKIGRQVQTWGTGDLVFLNDLFPKDFVSFFAGRDDEYLKAPGNSIRLTRFADAINVDFVWTPIFEPDVYLTGERFSFYSPIAGENIAPSPPFSAEEPDESFSNGEFALRLYRTIESTEYAVYTYHGFFKQPLFAPMTSVGASIRRPMGPGLINLETSYYASRDDRDGDDPSIPNDQLRFLVGYEWEARQNLTVSLQYYLERTESANTRNLLTNRLTYRAGMDKYTWSLFTFFSPSDSDFYLRPQFTYRHSDQWSFTAGANLFGGSDAHTFFNQLQDASNAYVRLRYHY
jgi:hypothetical protein